ncbi:MAG: VOC family protein [Candidatus Helarchaeota archaeon]
MVLKFDKIDQIGIIVNDCEATAKILEKLFGIGPFQIFDRGIDDFFYKGKWNKIHIKNALCRMSNLQIELIEVVEVIEGTCLQKEFIDMHGPGIHHIGIFVDDLDEALKLSSKEGINVIQKGKTKGLLNWAYLDTEKLLGFILEFIELRPKRKKKKS